MRTLVIGGTGFIGRHVVRELSQSGRTLTIVGLKNAASVSLPHGAEYHCISTAEGSGLESLAELFEEIVDLAYSSVPKTSYDDPIKDISDNLPRFVHLLKFAAIRSCRRLLFVSSGGAVYGQARFLPITEEHPLDPISPYGITKLAAEKYAAMYALQEGIDTICLRPGNVYGDGQLPFRGQGFVATAIGSVLMQKPITVFGSSGGVRDYVHVRDMAKAVLAALERGRPGATYNVGTGRGLSTLDILDMLKASLPEGFFMPPLDRQPERVFDVRENILDCSRLTGDTGWRPEIAFEDGLHDTFSRLREHYRHVWK